MIYFLSDIYRGDQEKNINIIKSILSPLMSSYNLEFEIVKNSKEFSFKDWVDSLSGEFRSELIELKLDKNDSVIAFEMNPSDKKYLKEKGVNWINFEIHPIRFLDDLYFSITSSFDFNWDRLSLSESDIFFYADVYKIKSKKITCNENSILIIGQSPTDKSVFFDGKFHGLADYFEKLDSIVEDYDCVYYRHHPYLTNPELDQIVLERYRAVSLQEDSFYDIISASNVKAVAGISSSSLYESSFFDKKVFFLENRIKSFGSPINIVSLYNHYESWLSILLSKKLIKSNKFSSIQFEANLLRKLFGSWSYPLVEENIARQNLSIHQINYNMSEIFTPKIEELDSRLGKSEAKASEAEAKASEAEAKASEAEAKASEAEAKASEAEVKASKAEVKASELAHNLHSILNSRSWRLTAPLRLVVKFIKWLVSGTYAWFTFAPQSRPRRALKGLLVKCKNFVFSRPVLKSRLNKLLCKYPKIRFKLKNLLSNRSALNFDVDLNNKEYDSSEFKENVDFYLNAKRGINTSQRTPLEREFIKKRNFDL